MTREKGGRRRYTFTRRREEECCIITRRREKKGDYTIHDHRVNRMTQDYKTAFFIFYFLFINFVRAFWMKGFTRTDMAEFRVECLAYAHSRARPVPSLTSPGYSLPPTVTILARRVINIKRPSRLEPRHEEKDCNVYKTSRGRGRHKIGRL